MLFACNAAWADKIGDFTATWPSETTNFGSPDVSAVRGEEKRLEPPRRCGRYARVQPSQEPMRRDVMTRRNGRPTIDFDHHSLQFAHNWREITADLRERCPVAWTDAHEGYWVITSYDLVRTVALDAETYSSDNNMSGERNGYQGAGAIPRSPFQLIPSEVDPPLFYSYRKLLNPKFSPAAAGTWRPFCCR
jgi:cytochrome P450